MATTSGHDDAMRALKALAMRVTDSAEGYEEAAKVARSREIQTEFRALARERRELARDMERRVIELGGDPREHGSLEAGAHRLFLDLRSVFEDDTNAAIKEVERGEAMLLEAFQDALRKAGGAANGARTAAYIREVEPRVRMEHDRWRALKRMIGNAPMHGGEGKRGSSDAGAAGPL